MSLWAMDNHNYFLFPFVKKEFDHERKIANKWHGKRQLKELGSKTVKGMATGSDDQFMSPDEFLR